MILKFIKNNKGTITLTSFTLLSFIATVEYFNRLIISQKMEIENLNLRLQTLQAKIENADKSVATLGEEQPSSAVYNFFSNLCNTMAENPVITLSIIGGVCLISFFYFRSGGDSTATNLKKLSESIELNNQDTRYNLERLYVNVDKLNSSSYTNSNILNNNLDSVSGNVEVIQTNIETIYTAVAEISPKVGILVNKGEELFNGLVNAFGNETVAFKGLYHKFNYLEGIVKQNVTKLNSIECKCTEILNLIKNNSVPNREIPAEILVNAAEVQANVPIETLANAATDLSSLI